jgi:hypothetical protein
MNYSIVLSGGCKTDSGSRGDGEYSGGTTIAEARNEGRFLRGHSTGGRVEIYRVLADSWLSYVETVHAIEAAIAS